MPVSDKQRKKYRMGGQSSHVDLELPSINEDGEHNVCKVRRIGVQGLIKLGVLDSLDTLTGLVASGIMEIQGEISPSQVKALAENTDKLDQALALIDQITLACVVEPAVRPVPTRETPDPARPDGSPWDWRDLDELYVDDVDLDDKLFIMNFCVGGSSDLKAFREETKGSLDAVADGNGVSSQAQ